MRVTGRGVLRGVLALVLALLVANLCLLWLAERSLARAVAEAPGLRTRLSDFVPPPFPKAENASSHLNAAGELCSLSPEEWRATQARSAAAPPGQQAEATVGAWREILRRNELALRVLDAAAGLERAWFEADYAAANPAGVRIPPPLQRRHLAGLLRARALVAAHEGRGDDAYRDVLLILRVADWCGQESPTLVSALVSIAIGGTAVDTLEDVMSRASPGSEHRTALDERLSRLRRADAVRRGLEGERTGSYGHFEALVGGHADPEDLGLPRLLGTAPVRSYLRFDQAASLRAVTTIIGRADRTVAELSRTGEADGPVVPRWAVITRITVPALIRTLHTRDELRARVDLARLALAAEARREAHGSYPPEALETWATTDRVDPVTGAPYGYEPTPDGFALRGQPGRRPGLAFVVTSPAGAVRAGRPSPGPEAGR